MWEEMCIWLKILMWTFWSIISVKDVYKKQLGYKNVQHVFVLEPEMNMNEGLLLV